MVNSILFYGDVQRARAHVAAPEELGWRLRALRLGRGITLVELAKRAALDASYLSRLERWTFPKAKPKTDTVYRVLHALGADAEECDAVFHIERPVLTREEIDEQVRRTALEHELSAVPVTLADEHWTFCYYNAAARAMMGFTPEEYRKSIGSHMLHSFIDPALPRYSRVPEAERIHAFAWWSKLFQIAFAGQQFDDWYLAVVDRIFDFPWAASVWENPVLTVYSLVLERQNVNVHNPVAGMLRFEAQINRLSADPRFVLSSWTPLDDETAVRLGRLRTDLAFQYGVLP
jgi:transcriptional regulator with XRE-family HTH domain